MVTPRLNGGSAMGLVNWSQLLQWMRTPSRTISRILKRLVAQCTIYLIWMERNARVHTGLTLSAAEIFKRIDRTTRDSLLARYSWRRCNGLLLQWFTYS
ncbi:unnamed protein product [Arabis nemorensis]|uniref:Reverse transcriptase zinc-binding domain-containing protein n=1 Tax=Arabis nemorensis TaxID=586526 RepID=A0A565CFU7_9BRAS|nr:unnamed protein product [Arabis nemorensis]